jgi:hypothetical protein
MAKKGGFETRPYNRNALRCWSKSGEQSGTRTHVETAAPR